MVPCAANSLAVADVRFAAEAVCHVRRLRDRYRATSGLRRVTGIRQQIWRPDTDPKVIHFRSLIAHLELLSPLAFEQLQTVTLKCV